jgi:hypothetical protein
VHSDAGRLRKSRVQRGAVVALCVLLLMSCGKVLGLQGGLVQAACTSDAECAPGYGCLQKLGCRNRCTADSDCGAGSRCFKAFVTTACIPITEEGCGTADPDSGASDGCLQGTSCDGRVCRTQCNSADECPGGQVCVSSGCVSTDPSREIGGAGAGTGGMSGAGASTGGANDIAGAAGAAEGGAPSPVGQGGTSGGIGGEPAHGGADSSIAGASAGAGTSNGGTAGGANPQCTAPAQRCFASDTPQICIDGSWATQPACAATTPKCDAGTCVACVGSAMHCASSSSTQTCAVSGAWGPASSCANGFCNGAGVCGECAAGVSRCSTQNTQLCSADGVWGMPTTCPQGFCNGAGVCGECVAGTSRCSGNDTQLCSAAGTWGPATTCANGFCNGAGVCGSCTAGSHRCTGNSTSTCSATGTWGNASACVSQACLATGTCGGVCTPNTFECSANLGFVCSAAGQWASNGSGFYCGCAAAVGRFTRAAPGFVLDTSTGLTWDVNMRAGATWADATNICAAAGTGMRIPTFAEWTGIMMLTACENAPSPFDEAAMPESSTTSGAFGTVTNLWTPQPEPGQGIQNVIMVGVSQPAASGQPWTTFGTDNNASTPHPYRCVGP